MNNQEVLINRMPIWVWEMDVSFVATTSMSEPSRYYTFTKRIFDIVSSAILITLSLPVWAILAIAVKLESKGPIFFRQTRTGQDGRPFEILKFRSMKVDAPKYARSPDEHNDPRITRVRPSFAAPASMKCSSSMFEGICRWSARDRVPFITAEYGAGISASACLRHHRAMAAQRGPPYAIHQSLSMTFITFRTALMDLANLLPYGGIRRERNLMF
jgi:hypothetical protein